MGLSQCLMNGSAYFLLGMCCMFISPGPHHVKFIKHSEDDRRRTWSLKWVVCKAWTFRDFLRGRLGSFQVDDQTTVRRRSDDDQTTIRLINMSDGRTRWSCEGSIPVDNHQRTIMTKKFSI
jgi:hypothetical protein